MNLPPMSEATCPRCGGIHQPDTACPEADLSGRTLAGGIQVREKLGGSDQVALYRAVELDTGSELELMTQRQGTSWTMSPSDTRDLDRLWDQLSRARGIRHPNVAGVRGMGMAAEGTRWIALEMLEGQLLSELLLTRGTIPVEDAVELIRQGAAGLEAAHERGVLHGSLSPDTILVTRTLDDRPLVKLVRFGRQTRSEYSAPEQGAGQRGDERSDVYSLGAVLYRLLAGERSAPAPRGMERIPVRFRPLLTKALQPAPEHRFGTAAAFARALETAKDTAADDEDPTPKSRRAVAMTVGLVVLTAGTWLIVGSDRPSGLDAGARASPSRPDTVPPALSSAPSDSASSTARGRSARPAVTERAGLAIAAPQRRPAAAQRASPAERSRSTAGSGAAPPETSSPDRSQAPPRPAEPVLGYSPQAPSSSIGGPSSDLTSTPAMRLAIGDVTRLDIVADYREVRPGRLVLVVGDGYQTSSSLEYNLRQLYAAYAQLLDYPRQSPILELWRDGRKFGEYSREGLRADSE